MKTDDHRYHKTALEQLYAKVTQLQESVTLALREIGDDDYGATHDTRARLVETLIWLGSAAVSVNSAITKLPKPAEKRTLTAHLGMSREGAEKVDRFLRGESDDVEGYARP